MCSLYWCTTINHWFRDLAVPSQCRCHKVHAQFLPLQWRPPSDKSKTRWKQLDIRVNQLTWNTSSCDTSSSVSDFWFSCWFCGFIACFQFLAMFFVQFPDSFEFWVYLMLDFGPFTHLFLMFISRTSCLPLFCYFWVCFLFYCEGSVPPCVSSCCTFHSCNYLDGLHPCLMVGPTLLGPIISSLIMYVSPCAIDALCPTVVHVWPSFLSHSSVSLSVLIFLAQLAFWYLGSGLYFGFWINACALVGFHWLVGLISRFWLPSAIWQWVLPFPQQSGSTDICFLRGLHLGPKIIPAVVLGHTWREVISLIWLIWNVLITQFNYLMFINRHLRFVWS